MGKGRHSISSILCFTLCVLMTVSGRSVPNVMSDQDVPLLPFRVTRVTQQPTNSGHNVQLFLTGPQPDLPTVYLSNWFDERRWTPERVGKPSNGTLQFHAESSDGYNIILLHPRGYHTFSLTLSEHSPSEQLIPEMELFLQGGREVTFQNGQDANLNYALSAENSSWLDIAFTRSLIIKSNTEDHVVDEYFNHSGFPFRDFNISYSENERRVHERILTSSGNVEGLLELGGYFRFLCPDNACLLERYAIHEDVPVYQEDHGGPFSGNYIGLLNRPDVTVCQVHAPFPCLLDCEVIGNQPSAVVFERVAGSVEPADRVSLSNGGFRAAGVLYFANLAGPGEAQYQCKSRSGPQNVSRTMTLIVVHDASINRNLTYVTTLDDGTVEAACVAEGTPAPTLELSGTNFSFSSTDGNVNRDSYEMVFTEPNGWSTKAVLRIHDPEVAGGVRRVVCKAENTVRGESYYDRMDFGPHDGGQWVTQLPPGVRYYLENYVNHTAAEEAQQSSS